MVDTIPALAWSGGPDGSVDFVNQRWLDYTGLSREPSYGRGWKTAIYSEDFPGLMAKWAHIATLILPQNAKCDCGASMVCSVGFYSAVNHFATKLVQ